jgi:hypothetical protein
MRGPRWAIEKQPIPSWIDSTGEKIITVAFTPGGKSKAKTITFALTEDEATQLGIDLIRGSGTHWKEKE